jgi:hypothetical protein
LNRALSGFRASANNHHVDGPTKTPEHVTTGIDQADEHTVAVKQADAAFIDHKLVPEAACPALVPNRALNNSAG